MLGAGDRTGSLGRVAIDSGVDKQLVKVALPREEHHQTSDLEQLLAVRRRPSPTDVGPSVLARLPRALRDDPGRRHGHHVRRGASSPSSAATRRR